MTRGSPYFAGLTKSNLTETIRSEIASYEIGQEFESKLISDLIAEKHYYCSRKQLRPVRFKKMFRPGAAYDFSGFFPGDGWHLVSWRQCITPRDEDAWLKSALREAIEPITSEYKSSHEICERCGAVRAEHVDHVSPEFDALALKAIGLLSEKEIEEAFVLFDWWSKEPFTLPESNPAVRSILKDHESAVLQAVCKPCHVANSRDRKKAQQVRREGRGVKRGAFSKQGGNST